MTSSSHLGDFTKRDFAQLKRFATAATTVLGYNDDPIKQQAKIAHLLDAFEDLPYVVKAWIES